MSKRVETNIPVQAETEAINWAVPQPVSHNIHKTIVESDAKSNCKVPNIAQKDYRAVEVTEKKEVPAAMWVVSAEPNFDQTENKISASKEIKGAAEAVATASEPHDSPMPKEVRKEWTCDICQLTTQSEKNLNSHLQGKKHKAAYEAFKAKDQPNMVSASTAKKTEQPVEELLKIVSTKGVKQRTITNQEEKQQGQPKSVLASTAKKSDQLKKEDVEKRVSTMDQLNRRKKLLV